MTEKLCYKGSDSCFAMQSPISASSHPLLVLRQQQLASTGISLVIFFHVFVIVLLIALMDLQVSYSPRVHSVAHMLLVTEAQGGDAGQYRCTARNEVFCFHLLLTLACLTSQVEIAMTKMFTTRLKSAFCFYYI